MVANGPCRPPIRNAAAGVVHQWRHSANDDTGKKEGSVMSRSLTIALLCASLSLRIGGPAHASSSSQPDQVIQWNRTLLQILQTPGAQPATIHPTRSMAIVQLAIYDAVDAIVGGHAPYLRLHAPRGASPEAAAAAAAHTALLSLFPSQQAVID